MDKTLVCRECGASFVFTQGEQDFYQSRGLANPPSRCPKCRAARRAQQAGSAPTVVTSRPPDSRPMYPATCARCGQQTQVPFQPRGDRPVYCSSCFHLERAAAPVVSVAPSWTAAPPSFAEALPEENRRERRYRKTEQRAERGERTKYSRRSRSFFEEEGDDEDE